MRIESVWIENFRSIRKLRLDSLGAFNVFHGENGAGKSNVLAAIEVAFLALGRWSRRSGSAVAGLLQLSDFTRPARTAGEMVIGVRVSASATGPRPVGSFLGWVELEFVGTAFGGGELTVRRLVTDRGDLLHESVDYPIPEDVWEWSMEALHRISESYRVLASNRAFSEEQTEPREPKLRGSSRIASLLRAGRLKQALAEAVTNPDIEVRAGLRRLQKLFEGEPLCRAPFDPIFDPSAGTYELNEMHHDANGEPFAIPVDLAGLGIQQVYSVMAGIFLGGASMVAVEAPEAQLHPRTTGRQLRELLKRSIEQGDIDQLFITTHSDIFDLDDTGYFLVRNDPEQGTVVERIAGDREPRS